MKTTVMGEEEQESGLKSFWQSLDESTTLSKTQRFYGFGICIGIGLIFYILAFVFWVIPPTFAVLYTMGSLLLFGSTFFLMGPWRQLKSLMKSHRILATSVYLLSLVVTLWAAFALEGLGKVLIIIILLILQVFALGWYVLTYIPYGQQAAGSVLSSVMTG